MQSESACLEEVDQAGQRQTRRTNTRAARRRPGARMPRALTPKQVSVDLATLATVDLAERCVAEQGRYGQRLLLDERVGLELFRRAIQQHDAVAWELVYQQWKGLLLHWLLQHPAARLVLEQASSESYLSAALSRFWQATTNTTYSQPVFETLADHLAYLRRCLNSVVLDAVRQIRARPQEVAAEVLVRGADTQKEASGGELWRCIERALPDARERQLLYLRYVLGYRPREVAARYPTDFPQVKQVYQMERTILQRLSRHPTLARWKA
jgi:DNA-directed RNA polymerase specialized sigma24 family protein